MTTHRLAHTLLLLAIALTPGCATVYAYQFEPLDAHPAAGTAPADTIEDADVRAAAQIAQEGITFDLANKGSEIIQVDWKHVTLSRGDGTQTSLRPDTDLGWVQPGGQLSGRLVPFVVPRSGAHAAAYANRRIELDLPLIVHNETKVYRFTFLVHVQPR